ncbi:alpha/beta hydrolase [Fulvivirga sp. M361]|uniref:alpha/beta hydrolase n=1 Tax=Fulvivirga sp. M361 TaxID=2594266 RepID=UPI001624BC65|nr:alpha/beta hydrolase [Fulvivirga sp. M361]
MTRPYCILITCLLICLASFNIYGQRYSEQIFEEVNKETVRYLNAPDKDLQIDIYQPANDKKESRPVILYVHGGGFAGGSRDEPAIIEFCENMARRGIVTVSMSYTLTMKGKSFGCGQAAANKLATFKHVALEIAEATRYIIESKKRLSIDPGAIVLAGSSAGAEAVLHAAYWKETQTPLPKSFTYGGVISMAGAIYDINLISAESAIPTQLFHGTCDNLVPYGTAPHHYCNEDAPGYLVLHGAASIADRLEKLKKGYYLMTGCNDGHGWAGRPFKKHRDEIAEFIWLDVLQSKFRQVHKVIETNKDCTITSTPEACSN